MKGLLISVVDPEGEGRPGVYAVSDFDGELDELQGAVAGLVDLIPTDPIVSMWVNDEGKFFDLPINRLAMDIWIRWDIHRCMVYGDWLAGNVVITGGGDARGNTKDLPVEARRWVMSVARDAGAEILTTT